MRRPGGPAKRARRHGTMCPSPHQGGTDRGCTLLPSPDLVPVQKRLGTFSAQFHDFRPVPAQISCGLMTDASHLGADRAPRQGDRLVLGPLGETRKCTNPVQTHRQTRGGEMHKQYEDEPRRIEHADDATITFTIALHGPHAWEMVLEDSRRYHSTNHGWAADDLHGWEDAIEPVLRQFFIQRAAGCRAGRSNDQDSPLVPLACDA